jgi:hypothetical protein
VFKTQHKDIVWQSCGFLRKGGATMSSVKYMDEEVMVQKAIKVLIGELGPIEANRFISMPRKKRIESVRRHRQWQKSLVKDKFFNKVFS